MMNRLLPFLLLLACITASAQTPDTFRICSWNVLYYNDQVDSIRSNAVQSVIRTIQPDILVAQEIVDSSGWAKFVRQVGLAGAPHSMKAEFEDARHTNNAIAFDTSKVSLIGSSRIPQPFRDINMWVFVVRASGDTIHVFGLHLKVGDNSADSIERCQDAAIIRLVTDWLPSTRHWIFTGSLGTYTSTEGAYTVLMEQSPGKLGYFVDPLDRPGDWRSSRSFTDIHTHATRVRPFGGSDSGGLDNRFDFVLLSPGLMSDAYLPGSYTTFGNDGQHFHDSINALPNLAVPDSIAEALHIASDHLPVYLDLVFQGKASGVREERRKVRPMDLTQERTELNDVQQ